MALSSVLGIVQAGLIIAQAFLIAHAIAPVIARTADLPDVLHYVWWIAGVFAARAFVTWFGERLAHRAAERVITDIREQVVAHSVALGPRWLADGHGPRVTTLVTQGLSALEPYFVRYLPQLVLAATLTPITLLIVARQDLVSAGIAAFTLPLIPVFMWLIGTLTQGTAERRLASMERLGSRVLDLLAGAATLRGLGRTTGSAARVRELGDSHRKATMGTLRVAFLSGMVLELLTTLCVALIAVSVGFRLVHGQLDFTVSLTVLILAPEIFQPIRHVGTQFHASTDGLAAASEAFEILETPTRIPGTAPAPDLSQTPIEIRNLSVAAPGRDVLAPAGLDALISPGSITVLRGPNGCGKSTTLEVLLRLLEPSSGIVLADGLDLADIDPESWWRQISWVPQRPVLEPGTVAEHLGASDSQSLERARAAAALTGLESVIGQLPNGWDTALGRGGAGLSVGQAHRLSLTKALLEDRPLLVLDEPTAHLDTATETDIHEILSQARTAGRTVVVTTHRDSLIDLADVVVDVSAAAAPVSGVVS